MMLNRFRRQPVVAPPVVEEYDFCEELRKNKASDCQDVAMSDSTAPEINIVSQQQHDDDVLMEEMVSTSTQKEVQVPMPDTEEHKVDPAKDEDTVPANTMDVQCSEHPEAPERSEQGVAFIDASTVRAPSPEELIAASQDLQYTLAGNHESRPENSSRTPSFSAPTTDELEAASRALQATNNSLSDQLVTGVTQGAEPSAVSYCLELFQRNPQVQAAVISLARDPAVWDAFVHNDKVQELLSETRKRKRFKFEADDSGSVEDRRRSSNPFWTALRWVVVITWGLMDALAEAVHGVFGFIDAKLFGGSSSDVTDSSVKACMVLTILMLALILVAR